MKSYKLCILNSFMFDSFCLHYTMETPISKYLEFWKLNIMKNEMYAKVMGPCIDYWEGILKCFSKPLPKESPILLEVFGHLVIRKLVIMCKCFFQFHLALRIRKIQLSLCIVGLKTWSHLWIHQLTHCLKIYMKEILFLFIHIILKCTQCGWEERIVMLPRMGMTSIIEFGACSKLQWWVRIRLPCTSLIVMVMFIDIFFLAGNENIIELMSIHCIGFAKLHFHLPCQ